MIKLLRLVLLLEQGKYKIDKIAELIGVNKRAILQVFKSC